MRRAKIVCTIGPSSSSYESLRMIAEAGMNVARLNFSHGSRESHMETLSMVRRVESDLGRPIGVLLDTKGPEIRTGLLASGTVMLKEGAEFTLCTEEITGNIDEVSVSFKELSKAVSKGQEIFIDDGAIQLKVESISDLKVLCHVVVGGELGDRKGVNIPGADLSDIPALTEKDVGDIEWGVKNEIEFVAVSFVRSRNDIVEVRKVIENAGGSMKIISKIEARQAVDRIEEILEISDGAMVARGDLGVECKTEDVPIIQKKLIDMCRVMGKPVIVATQMLDSMIRYPRPTRAEASDVANAVLDGADALMLSGETAKGKYPLEAVRTMANIIERTETGAKQWEQRRHIPVLNTVPDAVSHAAVDIAENLGAKCLITLSRTGSTARMAAKYRPKCPIIASTPRRRIQRDLTLLWGVTPLLGEDGATIDNAVDNAIEMAKARGFLNEGDLVVITGGAPVGIRGTTNMVQVQSIGKILLKGLSVFRKEKVGPVCVAMTAEEAHTKLQDGDVLVVKTTNDDYLTPMKLAGAIVCEEKRLTSHSALTALEMGIPCIVGAENATEILKDGMIVTVDGARGLVYEGRIKLS